MNIDSTIKGALIGAVATLIAALISLFQPYIFSNKMPLSGKDVNEKLPDSHSNLYNGFSSQEKVARFSLVKKEKLHIFDIDMLGISKIYELPDNIYVKFKNLNKNATSFYAVNNMFSGKVLHPPTEQTVIISATVKSDSLNLNSFNKRNILLLSKIKRNGEIYLKYKNHVIVLNFHLKFYDKKLQLKYNDPRVFDILDISILKDIFTFYKKIT